MSDELTCDVVVERGLIERYVADRLPEDEAQAFENHYVACPRCQDELRLAVAVREAASDVSGSWFGRRSLMIGGAGVGLAAAAVLIVLLLPATGSRQASDLARLGEVIQPPIYLGIPVRAADTPADSLFDSAMDAYVAEEFERAADGLAAALAAGVDSAPAEFFLGSSLLMEDETEDAARAFRRVIALGETPYMAEARYYLAKALLRLGQAEEALTHLRLAARQSDELREPATALADSVEEELQR